MKAMHVAFAVPCVLCVLWGFTLFEKGEATWPTLGAWALAFAFGTLHGTCALMGERGRGFFGAIHRWQETIEPRRKALCEELEREVAALDTPRAPDHFPA